MLNLPYAWKSFWTQQIELLGDVGHVDSHFGPFGDSFSATARKVHGTPQSLEIILDALDGTPR